MSEATITTKFEEVYTTHGQPDELTEPLVDAFFQSIGKELGEELNGHSVRSQARLFPTRPAAEQGQERQLVVVFAGTLKFVVQKTSGHVGINGFLQLFGKISPGTKGNYTMVSRIRNFLLIQIVDVDKKGSALFVGRGDPVQSESGSGVWEVNDSSSSNA